MSSGGGEELTSPGFAVNAIYHKFLTWFPNAYGGVLPIPVFFCRYASWALLKAGYLSGEMGGAAPASPSGGGGKAAIAGETEGGGKPEGGDTMEVVPGGCDGAR